MEIYLDFIFSAVLLLGLVAIYEFGTSTITFRNNYTEVWLSGMAIGLMTIIILSNPVHVEKGIFVDARWVLLSCAAIFLNWRVVIIGGVIAAGFRYFQGGTGAFPGVMSVVTAVSFGFLWRFILLKSGMEFKWFWHYIFALTLEGTVIFVIYIFMPEGKGPFVAEVITEPLLTLFPIVSTLLSLLLQHHWKRKVLEFN